MLYIGVSTKYANNFVRSQKTPIYDTQMPYIQRTEGFKNSNSKLCDFGHFWKYAATGASHTGRLPSMPSNHEVWFEIPIRICLEEDLI